MDKSPEPTREDDLSTANQPLTSSGSEEHTKHTEAMTGDCATGNPGLTIQDEEHAKATKERSFTSSPESSSKSHHSSVKHARVTFLDSVTLAEPELKKSEVESKTEHNIEEPLAGLDQEPNKHASQVHASADLGGALPKSINSAVVTKEPESTTNTSDVNNGPNSENAPKIGFKHDPDEERVLANVELDDGSSSKSKKKKKKNKRRPKSQRGENAPTGFEPFYADAPMTPKEAEENKSIYDPALPILDRIDEGIKRFLYKRRLEPYRRKVFLKYLQYGGVSVGPNHSQGVTPSELKEMTKEEAMQARCTTATFPKRGKPYPISFNDVATGYLTGFYMGHYNPDTEEEIKVCTDTMKNFFTYLLYHNVCPEQKEDLEEARRTCDRAAKELWMNQQLVHHGGPGDFNRGCSVLFGGYYFGDVHDPEAWENVPHFDGKVFTIEMARKAVKYGVAIAGNDRTARKFKILADLDMIEAKQVPDIDGFEVISVEEPSEETIGLYRELAPDLGPVGKIRAKEFRDPARGPFDLAPWEKVDWDAGFAPTYEFEFLVEPDLFPYILPGMKIISGVYETNFGQYYFDEIMSVLPSFYKFMYNDWMMDYVVPAPIKYIPDEEEVARRRAKESIMRPPEPTPAEWAMHMMAHEIDWVIRPGQTVMDAVWQMIHTLERFGWDMEEVKDLLGLVDPNPLKGKERANKGELRPVRLSNEPRNIPLFETPDQAFDRTIGYFQNPERIKPVIAPEVIAKILKQKKEKLEKEQAEKEVQASVGQNIEKSQGAEGQPKGQPNPDIPPEAMAYFMKSVKKQIEKEQAEKGAETPITPELIQKFVKKTMEYVEKEVAKRKAQTSDEQKTAKNQVSEGQPRRGPTNDKGIQTVDGWKNAKSQEAEGQSNLGATDNQATQTTSGDQKAAKKQESEGQPNLGATDKASQFSGEQKTVKN
ncbi:hypothetical protein N7519_005787 [Penicillium mononematosum]|uniref:uncharacterized protein n=1 Tax=Penicillium mononematosum TaxID=268346 RepID=UPI0025496B96|nr:uncharacterized protein N7519_005787 [Penicillium mononematosum]KAJ6184486.1 hypothetical protein N7519_005787 [Penicillium mononematosum]